MAETCWDLATPVPIAACRHIQQLVHLLLADGQARASMWGRVTEGAQVGMHGRFLQSAPSNKAEWRYLDERIYWCHVNACECGTGMAVAALLGWDSLPTM